MPDVTFPNESPEYRCARRELLEAEIELRARVESVAAMRRRLPMGGKVREDYLFDGPAGKTRLSDLFAPGKDTLFLYAYMFGPKMKSACPLCTSFLDALDGEAPHIEQRINLAVVARSPLERIRALAEGRGWRHLRLLSDHANTFHRDYNAETPGGDQLPMANVFVRRDGAIHHFWGSEMLFHHMEGADTRHIDMLWPLWNVLDCMPEGRGRDWYPKLEY